MWARISLRAAVVVPGRGLDERSNISVDAPGAAARFKFYK